MKTRHAKFSENEHFLPPDTHSGIFRILLNQRVTKFNRALEVKQSKHKYWKATYIRTFLTHSHFECFRKCSLSWSMNFREARILWLDRCWPFRINPAGNYMFKVTKGNTRAMFEICSKLTIKTQEQRQRHRSSVFIC